MPPYWNYQRKRRYYPRRRRNRFRRWRARKAIFRKYRRRTWTRRRKVKKRLRKRKLKKIIVKQFQPKKIVKCKVLGHKCLFQGSPLRSSNNYILYCYSYVPEYYPGGGGWSILVHSLGSLYEDFKHLKNYWTASNVALPLVRYLGCEFTFYQSDYTDYCVVWDNCWPLVDTPLTHADSCPQRMLQRKHKIIIPSRYTQQRKKPYKKVRVTPPTQMMNRWYFQKDICDTPLVMLRATAISLRHPFCDPKAKSNNITLYALNPHRYRNPNFQNPPITNGYSPFKADNLPDNPNIYLWASHIPITTKKHLINAIPLANTKDNKLGVPLKELNKSSQFETNNKFENWGNPFEHTHLNSDEMSLYISTIGPTDPQVKQWLKYNDDTPQSDLTLVVGPNLYKCRYNPERDTGEGNKAYLINNSSATNLGPPSNENLIIEGFPLPVMLWGWTDFVKKLKQTIDIDKNYILVIVSPFFEEKLPYYIFLDEDFKDGFEPYTSNLENNQHIKTAYNQQHWYPKYLFQTQSIEKICRCGPACARPTDEKYLQAWYRYKFYFKWGGCPKQLESVNDPCLQSKWPTPDNFTPRLEITSPNEYPQTQLYDWDWEEEYVKEEAIKRIQAYTEPPKSILFFTDSKSNPKPLQKAQEKEPPDNQEETQLLLQLHRLRNQRQLIQLQLQSKLTTLNL